MVTRRRFLAAAAGSALAGPYAHLLAADAPTPVAAAGGRAKALLFDHADKWTGAVGAERLLADAGFDVAPLPLDRSPYELKADLIFLGSFASDDPRYAAYMGKFGKELYRFVDRGKVLVQMAQADQTEATPPFLPSTHGCRRVDADFPRALLVSPAHPLAKDLPTDDGAIDWGRKDRRTIWESLVDQQGFEVIVAAEKESIHPGLMEGAYGQGRIVLAAMDFDKQTVAATGAAYATDYQAAFARQFFRNLHAHALNVRNRTTAALDVTAPAKTVPDFVPGSWTLAVLPDTQVYSLRYPGLFTMQTHWVAEHRDRLNIKCALHLGDITNNNTRREWENARAALDLLHGRVPTVFSTGNHDLGPSGDASTRDTHLNTYLPPSKWRRQPTFGGTMREDDGQNTYHLLSAGDAEWVVVALEWGPRDDAVAWANEVMASHADRRGILITHAFVNNNDRRYDFADKSHPQDFNPHLYKTPGPMNDGEQLWQKLVRRHDFRLVFNGHVLGDGAGYVAEKTSKGHTCHQMLSNYQMRTLGGEGYLRLVEFRPDGKTVQVKTYSPLYDKYMIQPDQQYAFEMD